jgi:hypothetical protein
MEARPHQQPANERESAPQFDPSEEVADSMAWLNFKGKGLNRELESRYEAERARRSLGRRLPDR